MKAGSKGQPDLRSRRRPPWMKGTNPAAAARPLFPAGAQYLKDTLMFRGPRRGRTPGTQAMHASYPFGLVALPRAVVRNETEDLTSPAGGQSPSGTSVIA